MVDPRQHAKTYSPEKQKAAGEFQVPPAGVFDVVNTHVQKMIVGAKATEKRRVRIKILSVVELDDASEDIEAPVGMTYSIDLWWNMDKAGNARRLCHMAAACKHADEFDENDDEQLVKAITGVAYRMKINVRSYQHNGKDRKDIEPVFTAHLPAATAEKYTKDPDWKKTIGAPADRVLEPQDYSTGSGSTGAGGGGGGSKPTPAAADPFHDDDLPFIFVAHATEA